jgi:hypothetical protein
MSATSEWVTPPTRPELIESLVSGVGPLIKAVLHVPQKI